MDSKAWDDRYANSPGLVWTAEANRFVIEEVADLPPGRALDLAAGEGRNAVWLAQHGWRVTAVDFSAVAVERGRDLAVGRGVTVDWTVADVTGYQPEPDAYDLVLIAYLHLARPALGAVLDRAARAVRPGGRLLVVGHDLTNLDAGTGGPQAPEVLYTPAVITGHLPGFHIERAETARRPVTVDGSTVDAFDTVVLVRR